MGVPSPRRWTGQTGGAAASSQRPQLAAMASACRAPQIGLKAGAGTREQRIVLDGRPHPADVTQTPHAGTFPVQTLQCPPLTANHLSHRTPVLKGHGRSITPSVAQQTADRPLNTVISAGLTDCLSHGACNPGLPPRRDLRGDAVCSHGRQLRSEATHGACPTGRRLTQRAGRRPACPGQQRGLASLLSPEAPDRHADITTPAPGKA